MGTTTNYALRYPELVDTPDIPRDLKNLAQDVDAKIPAVPIGMALEWDYAAASIPSWSLLPYGQAISRTTYAALAALASSASYPHGSGDGSTTFNISDKRGRVSAGKDDMGGTAASRITAAISGTAGTVLGAAVGNEGVTLAIGQIPSHDHTAVTGTVSVDHSHTANSGYVSADHTHGISDPQHAHNIRRATGWISGGGSPAASQQSTAMNDIGTYGAGTGVYTGGESAEHTHTYSSGGASANHNHGVTAQGGGGAHLNTGPTIICNMILRVL